MSHLTQQIVVLVGFARFRARYFPTSVRRALLLSLVVHLTLFGCMWIPLNKFAKALQERLLAEKKESKPTDMTLKFVEVNMAQAVAEAPKDAKFYGAANVLPSKATEQKPEISRPMQPTTAPVAPPLAPSEVQPVPKPVNDLALAKPQVAGKTTTKLEPLKPTAEPLAPEPIPKASTQLSSHDEKTERHDISTSAGVKNTIAGEYDQRFAEMVQRKWDTLIPEVSSKKSGKVVVEFCLHYDGRVTDIKIRESTVDEMRTVLCKKAILDLAPYPKWSTEMRKHLQSDTRDVAITFSYKD